MNVFVKSASQNVCYAFLLHENFSFKLLLIMQICDYAVQRSYSIWGLCLGHQLLFIVQALTRIYKPDLSHTPYNLFSLFQTIFFTAQKASPLRFFASTSLPWKGTLPTSSEQSFELWGCQTQAPRGTNSGSSSTRCVKVPFPCPSTKIKGQAQYRQQGASKSIFPEMWSLLLTSSYFVCFIYYASWLVVNHDFRPL